MLQPSDRQLRRVASDVAHTGLRGLQYDRELPLDLKKRRVGGSLLPWLQSCLWGEFLEPSLTTGRAER
jgi:hypothetical protein